jgi:uncharacterized protein YjbI with pentapeptide repeats
LEEYELERLQVCDPAEFAAKAVSESGINGYETNDLSFDFSGESRTFVAENCRLMRGSLEATELELLSLAKSALVSVDVTMNRIERFEGSDIAVYAGSIRCNAGVVRFIRSVFRLTSLTIRSTDANFSDSDLAVNRERDQPDLVELARAASVPIDEAQRDAPVMFVKCDFPGAKFDRALLQGARFIDCRMPGASFEQANLMGASFEGCGDLSDVRFDLAQSVEKMTVDGAGL